MNTEEVVEDLVLTPITSRWFVQVLI